METSRIISESIKNSNSSKVNDNLKDLLSKLESFPINTLLSDKFSKSDELFGEIAKIIIENFHTLTLKDKSENDKINQVSSIISTVTPYLIKAIKNNDLKLLLIFLLTKRYEINVIELLKNEKISEKDCLPLLSNLSNFFQNFRLEINVPDNSSFSDKKTIKSLKKAFKDDNIDQFYLEFDSIERGVGLHLSSIEKLLFFMKDCNFPIFLRTLSNIDNIFLIILFLQNLDENELLEVGNNNPMNKWLNVELIRQILKKEKENFIEESYITVRKILKKIYEEDYNFFKHSIKYFNKYHPFNNSNLFNASLGSLLASFNNSKIEKIFNDCFEIDVDDFHLKSRTTLLNRFEDNASNDKIKFFLSIVFNKWESFLIKSNKSEDFFQNRLILTDFCNFIIHYYCIMITNEEIVNQLSDLFKSIKYIDSKWFISSNKQITQLFLYYSRVFLLSYAYYDKKINNGEIRDLFSDFEKNKIIIHRISSYNDEKFKSSLKDINEKLKLM